VKSNPIEIEIDKLTHSVENRITGDSFDTQVIEITEHNLSQVASIRGMGYIEEPKGVTLTVDKLTLTQEVEERIKNFIDESKERNAEEIAKWKKTN